MKLRNLYFLALAGGSVLSLASCQNEEPTQSSCGQNVRMTVNITKVSGEETRATLSEVNGNLKCTWDEGDIVMVTDANGNKLGLLKLISGAGQESATFDGTIYGASNGESSLNFLYLGHRPESELNAMKSPVVIDYSMQPGSAESLSAYDFFTSTQTVNIADGSVYTPDMGLSRKVAFGHFDLIFPAGVEYTDEVVTVSGSGINNSVSVGLNNSVSYSAGSIRVNGTKDFYMTFLPEENVPVAPEFRVTIDGKVYKGSKGARTMMPSEFLREADGVGIPVTMELTDEDPDAVDPGDFGNWGGDVAYPEVKYLSLNKIGGSNDAWTHNWYTDVDVDYGFAAPAEYEWNAIKGNHLTSASYSDGTEAKYFQWGRWLGFPMNVVYAQVNGGFGFGMIESMVKYPRGINPNKQVQLYYCWDMDSRPCYAYCTDTNWGKQQAVNSSIIFGVNANDYLKTNEDCEWEDRSGNPCPDGYRLPTMEEMEVFAPSAESISGTHAEVKNINGTLYAMKWTVSATSVFVQSVPAKTTTVKADDPIFDDAKGITLEANGMLYCDYPNSISDSPSAKFATSFDGGTKTGGYWTRDSRAWADGGFAGVALMVRIKNGKASIGLELVERTAGLCIIPIKAETRKATAIRPWFPIGY